MSLFRVRYPVFYVRTKICESIKLYLSFLETNMIQIVKRE